MVRIWDNEGERIVKLTDATYHWNVDEALKALGSRAYDILCDSPFFGYDVDADDNDFLLTDVCQTIVNEAPEMTLDQWIDEQIAWLNEHYPDCPIVESPYDRYLKEVFSLLPNTTKWQLQSTESILVNGYKEGTPPQMLSQFVEKEFGCRE